MEALITHIKNYRELITFTVLIGGYFWKGRDVLAANRSKKDTEMIILQEAIKAVLHDKIYNYCHVFLKEQEVTSGGLNNLEILYKSYKALGGNGTAETLYKKVQDLPIKQNN